MKRLTINMLLASCATLGFGGSAAWADCAEEISALQAETGSGSGGGESEGGIAKDGSLAPLEEASGSGGQGGGSSGDVATTSTAGDKPTGQDAEAADENQIAKDGTLAPLAENGVAAGGSDTGTGEDSTVALSQQEAEAQQQGVPGSASGTRAEALERAQAALDRGDEEACMEAVEEARGL